MLKLFSEEERSSDTDMGAKLVFMCDKDYENLSDLEKENLKVTNHSLPILYGKQNLYTVILVTTDTLWWINQNLKKLGISKAYLISVDEDRVLTNFLKLSIADYLLVVEKQRGAESAPATRMQVNKTASADVEDESSSEELDVAVDD